MKDWEKQGFAARAEILGAAAHWRGIGRSPALDNEMLDLMREVNPSGLVGNPHTIIILKAWLSGWTREALNESDAQ